MRKLLFGGAIGVLLLLSFLYVGLYQNPAAIRSPVMNQLGPSFKAYTIGDNVAVDNQQLKGKPYLLNIWSTWCSSCALEHKVWMDIYKTQQIPIIGVLYHDNIETAKKWLYQNGNPYKALVSDPGGRLVIDLGAYGTPETLLVDKDGIIRKRFIGPVTKAWLNQIIKEYNV